MRQDHHLFTRRLAAIGVDVELMGNYPWVYLTKVNGNTVVERFRANHGFHAFTICADGSVVVTDLKEVFNIVRKYK